MKSMNFFIKIIFLFLLVSAGLFSYAKFVEPHTLVEKSVEVSSPFVMEEARDLKIAVFSDTHFSESYGIEDFQKVMDSIGANKPDILLFSGDLIDNLSLYDGEISQISDALASIKAPLGKFAIFGNHDYGGGAEKEYADILNAGGFTVLKNQYVGLDDYKISIIGIDDFMLGYGDISKATWARSDYYNILLCHEPDIADSILETNIDLMVSGHTHGGQIQVPGFTEKYLPPYGENYVKGLFEFNNNRGTKLYVNPGLGTTQIPLRFLCSPEITYITLSKS